MLGAASHADPTRMLNQLFHGITTSSGLKHTKVNLGTPAK